MDITEEAREWSMAPGLDNRFRLSQRQLPPFASICHTNKLPPLVESMRASIFLNREEDFSLPPITSVLAKN